MYGQFNQNEQPFRTNYVQVFLYWNIYYTYSKYVPANFKVSVQLIVSVIVFKFYGIFLIQQCKSS